MFTVINNTEETVTETVVLFAQSKGSASLALKKNPMLTNILILWVGLYEFW